jgi:hypothetical protein
MTRAGDACLAVDVLYVSRFQLSFLMMTESVYAVELTSPADEQQLAPPDTLQQKTSRMSSYDAKYSVGCQLCSTRRRVQLV